MLLSLETFEDCFDTLSFECIDFQRLSHIFARLTRENLQACEVEVSTLPWTQTEKDIALARCRSGQRAWLQMKRATPWIMKMNLVEDFEYW